MPNMYTYLEMEINSFQFTMDIISMLKSFAMRYQCNDCSVYRLNIQLFKNNKTNAYA